MFLIILLQINLIYFLNCAIIFPVKKRSFLEKKSAKENKRFDAFNVINMMMFIALITLFVISLCFCVNNMTAGKTDKNYTIFLIMHILAIVIACLPFLAKKIFKILHCRSNKNNG